MIGILDFRHRRVASGSFGNPNLLSGYMVIALPVITGLLLANVNKVRKFLYITSIITILFVLYLCKSRGAWLALAGGALTFLILLTMNNKRRLIMLVLSMLFAGTIIFSLFLVPLTEELLLDVRPFIWRGTVKMIKAHPVIGVGYGTYLINYPDYRSKEYFFYSHTLGKERGWQAQDVTDHAHSEYLEIASETGLIGLTAFFSIIVIFFVLIIKALKDVKGAKERFILIGLASGVVSALIDNTVNISMRFVSSSIFFWFSMAASLAIISKSPSPPPSPARGEGKTYINAGLVIVIFLLGLIFYKTTCIDFRASAYLMKGVKSRTSGEWQAAINHYKKAVSIDPYLLTAHYRLAFAYNEVGDLDKAIETYKGIGQIAPHYAKTEANIGKVYMKKGMLNEALLYFEKAENLNPYDIDLLCNIGSLYMRLGDLSNAKCYVRRALTIEPGNEYASSVMKELK